MRLPMKARLTVIVGLIALAVALIVARDVGTAPCPTDPPQCRKHRCREITVDVCGVVVYRHCSCGYTCPRCHPNVPRS